MKIVCECCYSGWGFSFAAKIMYITPNIYWTENKSILKHWVQFMWITYTHTRTYRLSWCVCKRTKGEWGFDDIDLLHRMRWLTIKTCCVYYCCHSLSARKINTFYLDWMVSCALTMRPDSNKHSFAHVCACVCAVIIWHWKYTHLSWNWALSWQQWQHQTAAVTNNIDNNNSRILQNIKFN